MSSPGELLEAAIERVEARNAKVNAVTMPLYDYARQAIADGLPDGPFRGVPFLMKDLDRIDRRRAHDPKLALLRRRAAAHRRTASTWLGSSGPASSSSAAPIPASSGCAHL